MYFADALLRSSLCFLDSPAFPLSFFLSLPVTSTVMNFQNLHYNHRCNAVVTIMFNKRKIERPLFCRDTDKSCKEELKIICPTYFCIFVFQINHHVSEQMYDSFRFGTGLFYSFLETVNTQVVTAMMGAQTELVAQSQSLLDMWPHLVAFYQGIQNN